VSGGYALALAGARLHALPEGALWWPAQRLLAIADLHFEKGSSYAERRTFLPPYDTAATLERLEALVSAHKPAHVAALGDSFHDGRAHGRLDGADRARLAALVARVRWTWVAGNHDPEPPAAGGESVHELRVGPLVFRHQAIGDRLPAGEVSGHFHPKCTLRGAGRTVSARCFVCDGRRLVLPAFGAYAGGLDVRDPALSSLFGKNFKVLALARGRVHALAAARLG
jgi:DNA ligase-associated metallophosphoesterase